MDRRGLLSRVVVDRCGIVVGRCGSLWDRCGSLWVVPGFSNYEIFKGNLKANNPQC